MNAVGNDINIKANNIIFCYDDIGKGGIPILFIHGFPFDKSMWQPQLEYLKSSNRVIAYDIRGFGKSTDEAGEVSINLFADDLIKLMDALEISKAIICGVSMGGYIALNAINRFSERFEGLILSDTQCIADSAEGRQKRYKTIGEIGENGLSNFAETFVKNVFCKQSLENKKEMVEKVKNNILATSPRTVKGTLFALAERWETCNSLEAITVPTLIICGKEDVLTPPAQSEFMKQNIKNSILHIIDGAGHLPNMEQAEEFNKYLQHFLSAINTDKTLEVHR